MVHDYTFQANKGYFGINLNGQGISLLFKRPLIEKWKLLIGEKGRKKNSRVTGVLLWLTRVVFRPSRVLLCLNFKNCQSFSICYKYHHTG